MKGAHHACILRHPSRLLAVRDGNRRLDRGWASLRGQQEPLVQPPSARADSKSDAYRFDGTMSREVLDNYLSRAISMEGLLNGRGDLDDNIRMLKSIGAKFIGRSLCLWGGEANLLRNLERAKQQIPKVHAADPEMILQACVFEIVTAQVEQVPCRTGRLSPWVSRWRSGISDMPTCSIPTAGAESVGKERLGPGREPAGDEALVLFPGGLVHRPGHRSDPFRPGGAHERQRPRPRALVAGARPGPVLCGQARSPAHGALRCPRPQRRPGARGRLLLDFHSFPLRIMEVPDRPQEAILKVGFSDGIYGRSKGGLTFSGWKCDHLPYLVEIDNWGVSRQPGKAKRGRHLDLGLRRNHLVRAPERTISQRLARYAWDWVRKTDPNGHLQMPGSRTMRSPLDRKRWYYANVPSPAVPEGLGDEKTIRAIWAADSGRP